MIRGVTVYAGLNLLGFPRGANPWTRRTIDNWYTSLNPTGKGFEAVGSDIDNDGQIEIVFSNHNHQDYKPNNVPSDPANHRIWPSGIYYFEIPSNLKKVHNGHR